MVKEAVAKREIIRPRVIKRRRNARKRLLRAGLEIVGKRGLHNLSVSDITEQADCSVGSFYTHFKSKEGFLPILQKEAVEPIALAFDAHGKKCADPIERLIIPFRYTILLAQADNEWGQFMVAIATQSENPMAGFGYRVLEDLRAGVDAGVFEIAEEGSAISFMVGAFIAAGFGASSNIMSENGANELALHVLKGLGVEAERAKAGATCKLPEFSFESEVVEPLEAYI